MLPTSQVLRSQVLEDLEVTLDKWETQLGETPPPSEISCLSAPAPGTAWQQQLLTGFQKLQIHLYANGSNFYMLATNVKKIIFSSQQNMSLG